MRDLTEQEILAMIDGWVKRGEAISHDKFVSAMSMALREARRAPVDMVLFCPKCAMQHIDAPESHPLDLPLSHAGLPPTSAGWDNPPHKSHLCHGCGHIWRPSDTPTNGVRAVASGKDSDCSPAEARRGKQEPIEIDWPEYHEQGMGCGLEDRGITDRYQAMRYGWDEAIERVAERLPEKIYTSPQPTFEDVVRKALAACERVRLKAISPEHVHSLAHRVANTTARECYNAVLALLEKKP